MDLMTLKLGILYILYPLLHRRPVPRKWKKTNECSRYTIADDKKTVRFELQHGCLEISASASSVFRVLFMRPDDPGYVSASVVSPETLALSAEEKNGFVHVRPEKERGMEAVVDLKSATLSFSYINMQLHMVAHSYHARSSWVSAQFHTHEREEYAGFGQKTGPFFKNGKKITMWNTDDPRVSYTSDPVYQSCPWMIGIRKNGLCHGIFFDNPHFSVIRPTTEKDGTKIFYAAEGGPLCYYAVGGPGLKDVMQHFTQLTGRYNLPPRWVLGHHHARWINDESEEKIKTLAKNFRQHKVPCDTIHIDIGHMEGYRSFTWSTERFPAPDTLIEELHKEGFKVVVIVDPGIKKDNNFTIYREGMEQGYFCTDKNGKVQYGPVWPGTCAFVDYSNPDARAWWGNLYNFYLKSNVDGFWNDMNEPSLFTHRRTLPDSTMHKGGDNFPAMDHKRLHNWYGLLMVKATYEGLARLQPDKRWFVFCRSSFTGVQQYASTWTGDNTSDWTHLKMSIAMILNMGLSGQVMTGSDIAGFWKNTTPELLSRWMQLGIFYPFCRNHTSLVTLPQEVWNYGEQALDISRKYLSLRYSLIPYLYTCLKESCDTGIPLMRPLVMEFPKDARCFEPDICETEFLSGPSLLVAPVVEQGAAGRSVYLPEGDDWFAFGTTKVHKGGTAYQIDAPLEHLPLFVRAGSVIPQAPPVLVTDEIAEKEIIFSVYQSDKIKGSLYIDNGTDNAFKKGTYSLISCTGSSKPKSMSLELVRTEGSLEQSLGTHPCIVFMIYLNRDVAGIVDVAVNGNPLPELKDDTGTSADGYSFSGNVLKVVTHHMRLPLMLDAEFRQV